MIGSHCIAYFEVHVNVLVEMC